MSQDHKDQGDPTAKTLTAEQNTMVSMSDGLETAFPFGEFLKKSSFIGI